MPTHYIKNKKPLCNTSNWGNWNSSFVKLGDRWAERGIIFNKKIRRFGIRDWWKYLMNHTFIRWSQIGIIYVIRITRVLLKFLKTIVFAKVELGPFFLFFFNLISRISCHSRVFGVQKVRYELVCSRKFLKKHPGIPVNKLMPWTQIQNIFLRTIWKRERWLGKIHSKFCF